MKELSRPFASSPLVVLLCAGETPRKNVRALTGGQTTSAPSVLHPEEEER